MQEKHFHLKDSPMFSTLEDLGVDFTRQDHTHYKFKAGGFMDLVVETWIEDNDNMKVSVCHYGEQNGDLMRDPEMVFSVGQYMEIPEYYRNDYTGLEQEVYPIINNVKMIRPALARELKSFARLWARNIRMQGFEKPKEKEIEN